MMHRRTFLCGLAAAVVVPLDVARRLAQRVVPDRFWKSSVLPGKPLTIEDLNRAMAKLPKQAGVIRTRYVSLDDLRFMYGRFTIPRKDLERKPLFTLDPPEKP